MFAGNTSSEDLDRLVERYLDPDETTEDTGGPEEEVAVTMVITRRTTEGVNAHGTAPFPVCLVRANIERRGLTVTENWHFWCLLKQIRIRLVQLLLGWNILVAL